jgi:3'-phosphoadenosine 5'-phosphosulfate synthase
MTHPGGLDPETTVMAIWPAPMVYAGPTEVQFHAKSRRNAGASYFVVGRDPAGMKGSVEAWASPEDDLYNGDHGRYVLQNAPGIAGKMNMVSFVQVKYDITDNVMKIPDPARPDDFISISGTKMRLLARNGATMCSATNIPTDLVAANCVPSGFMVPKGWDKVVDYYKHSDEKRWIPWSQPNIEPRVCTKATWEGKLGRGTFEIRSTIYDSWWHDIPYKPADEEEPNIINFVTEIPMYMAAKMEVQKTYKNNAIAQDSNKDGSPRYYSYGTPFFNYGFVPQTWEDPNLISSQGHAGDNDPVDIMEFGSIPLKMGSVRRCRVLGSLELIDAGETDHKIICIALHESDDDEAQEAANIKSLDDLEKWKPGVMDRVRDWLKRYKTSDGKPENNLASDVPKTIEQAMAVVEETHNHWKSLCGHDGSPLSQWPGKIDGFYLDSPGCRGE